MHSRFFWLVPVLLAVLGAMTIIPLAHSQSGGPPPAPAPTPWSLPANGSTQIVTNAGTPRDYQIKNDGPSPVVVHVTNADGEDVTDPVTIQPDSAKNFGVQPTQNIKIKDGNTGADGASGTFKIV